MVGSPEPNAELSLQCDVFFRRNIHMLLTRLSDLSTSIVKWYTRLIYVEEKSFFLIDWVFPLVGPFLQQRYKNISCIWGLRKQIWTAYRRLTSCALTEPHLDYTTLWWIYKAQTTQSAKLVSALNWKNWHTVSAQCYSSIKCHKKGL